MGQIRNQNLIQADAAGEAQRCADDCVYWINTYCHTFDPRSKPSQLPFELYPYQVETVRKFVDAIREGRDIFAEKSRDMGVTWLILAVFTWFWLFKSGYHFKVGSRKEDEVDDWKLATLFPKIQYLIENQPFQPAGFDMKKQRRFMALENPENGNTITGESANPDYSRGGRYNAILYDEFAFWPWQESSWDAGGDSTPCRIAITTPSEQPSYAKTLRNSGLVHVETLHWRLHPKKDQAWYDYQKSRRTSDAVARELDINWEGSTKGVVYPEIHAAQVGHYPYIPNQPLYTGWDFGLDGTAIQWWQLNPDNGKWRLVDSYADKDKVIEYYFPLFGNAVDSQHAYSPEDLAFFREISQLPKPTHFGDPDVEKRSIQTGRRTRDALEAVGIYVNTDPKANDLETRKTETKLILQAGFEVNETPRNQYWLDCMQNARYPQRQDTSQSTTPNLKPVHDWTSHHRTATEYFAVNKPGARPIARPRRERVYDPVTGRLIS